MSIEKEYTGLINYLLKSSDKFDDNYMPIRDYHMGLLMMLAPLSVKDIRNIEKINKTEKKNILVLDVTFKDNTSKKIFINKYLKLFSKVLIQHSNDLKNTLSKKLKSNPNYPYELLNSFRRDIDVLENYEGGVRKIRNYSLKINVIEII